MQFGDGEIILTMNLISIFHLIVLSYELSITQAVSSYYTKTLAGVGISIETLFNGDGIPATSATIYFPTGVWISTILDSFVADTSNNRIRKVSSSGIITTVVGTGSTGPANNGGPATSASLLFPVGVWQSPIGYMYFSEQGGAVIRWN